MPYPGFGGTYQRRGQAPGQSPFRLGKKKGKNIRAFGQGLEPLAKGRGEARGSVEGTLMSSLQDPTGGAEAFLPFFERAATAAGQDVTRDFERATDVASARTASRFGGNVSTEEIRSMGGVREDFQDTLSRMLAQIGPQAIGAAQGRTSQLLGARQLFGGEELDVYRMLMQNIQGQKEGSNFFGKLAGTALGIGGKMLL